MLKYDLPALTLFMKLEAIHFLLELRFILRFILDWLSLQVLKVLS